MEIAFLLGLIGIYLAERFAVVGDLNLALGRACAGSVHRKSGDAVGAVEGNIAGTLRNNNSPYIRVAERSVGGGSLLIGAIRTAAVHKDNHAVGNVLLRLCIILRIEPIVVTLCTDNEGYEAGIVGDTAACPVGLVGIIIYGLGLALTVAAVDGLGSATVGQRRLAVEAHEGGLVVQKRLLQFGYHIVVSVLCRVVECPPEIPSINTACAESLSSGFLAAANQSHIVHGVNRRSGHRLAGSLIGCAVVARAAR